MLMRGLRMRARYLHFYQKLLITFVTALLLFIFLRKKIIMSKAKEVEILLLSNGLRPDIARYATAQAANESANFTSIIFLLNKNCYGMTYAGQKTAQGSKNGYAYYNSLEECIIDLVDWYNRHRDRPLALPLDITSLSDYVDFLKSQNYFEDTKENYLKGCTYFYNMYFNGTK